MGNDVMRCIHYCFDPGRLNSASRSSRTMSRRYVSIDGKITMSNIIST